MEAARTDKELSYEEEDRETEGRKTERSLVMSAWEGRAMWSKAVVEGLV